MQSPENLRIIKWCYFKILYVLLHLLRKVRWRKWQPESSALLLSAIMLHSLGKILLHKEGAGSFAAGRSRLSPDNPRGSETQPAPQTARRQWGFPTAMELRGAVFPFTPTNPWICQLTSVFVLLTFWESALALLPFYRWKTNLSCRPAILIFLKVYGVLKFTVICQNTKHCTWRNLLQSS